MELGSRVIRWLREVASSFWGPAWWRIGLEDTLFGVVVVWSGRPVGPYLGYGDGALEVEGKEEDGGWRHQSPFTEHTRIVAAFQGLPCHARWSIHPARGCLVYKGLVFGRLNSFLRYSSHKTKH